MAYGRGGKGEGEGGREREVVVVYERGGREERLQYEKGGIKRNKGN